MNWTNIKSILSLQVDLSDHYKNIGEWKVLSTSAKLNKRTYSCCAEPYLDTEFTFNIERKSATYKTAIIAPCLVLMLLTICSFLLTPDSGEKIWINGVALIGSIIYLVYISNSLPFHDAYVPLIGT